MEMGTLRERVEGREERVEGTDADDGQVAASFGDRAIPRPRRLQTYATLFFGNFVKH